MIVLLDLLLSGLLLVILATASIALGIYQNEYEGLVSADRSLQLNLYLALSNCQSVLCDWRISSYLSSAGFISNVSTHVFEIKIGS